MTFGISRSVISIPGIKTDPNSTNCSSGDSRSISSESGFNLSAESISETKLLSSDAHPETHARSKITRSPLAIGAALFGLVGIPSFVASESWLSSERTNLWNIWGSPDTPKFLPRLPSTSTDCSVSTFSQGLIEARERMQKSRDLEAIGNALVKKLNQGATSEELQPEIDAFLQQTGSLTKSREVITKQLSDEDLERQLGSPEAYAAKLFELTTGSPLPAHVKSSYRADFDQHTRGTAHERSGQVNYGGHGYAQRVATLLHEYGHLVTTVRSDDTYGVLSVLGPQFRSAEENKKEEALAELFRLAATAHVEIPELKAEMGGVDDWAITESLRGRETDQQFFAACLTADAALTVFGDPATAFRKLYASSKIPSEVIIQVERTCALWNAGPSPDTAMNELLAVRKNILSLQTLLTPKSAEPEYAATSHTRLP